MLLLVQCLQCGRLRSLRLDPLFGISRSFEVEGIGWEGVAYLLRHPSSGISRWLLGRLWLVLVKI